MPELTIEAAAQTGYELGQQNFYTPRSYALVEAAALGDDALRARAYKLATGYLPTLDEGMYNAFADRFVAGWHDAEAEKAARLTGARLEIRLPVELKRWAVGTGNSADLIRRLLEAERARQEAAEHAE